MHPARLDMIIRILRSDLGLDVKQQLLIQQHYVYTAPQGVHVRYNIALRCLICYRGDICINTTWLYIYIYLYK